MLSENEILLWVGRCIINKIVKPSSTEQLGIRWARINNYKLNALTKYLRWSYPKLQLYKKSMFPEDSIYQMKLLNTSTCSTE